MQESYRIIQWIINGPNFPIMINPYVQIASEIITQPTFYKLAAPHHFGQVQ